MPKFILGIAIASVLWVCFLSIASIQAIKQYREIEHQAYSESYRLKQHNNKLEKENRNLYSLNLKLRRKY